MPTAIMPYSSSAQAMAVMFPVASFQQGNNTHKNAHIKYMLFRGTPALQICNTQTHTLPTGHTMAWLFTLLCT